MAAQNGPMPAGNMPPEVQRWFTWSAETVKELDALRQENTELINQLRVARAHISELQHSVDYERTQKESFQRYCVSIEEMVQIISRAAQRASDAGVAAAKQLEKPIPKSKQLPEVEAGIETLVDKLNSSPSH